MSEEPRPDPLGPTHPLMHHQAGVIASMLEAMCKEDKDMVLSYLGLMEIEDAPPPESRKMGEPAKKKAVAKNKRKTGQFVPKKNRKKTPGRKVKRRAKK